MDDVRTESSVGDDVSSELVDILSTHTGRDHSDRGRQRMIDDIVDFAQSTHGLAEPNRARQIAAEAVPRHAHVDDHRFAGFNPAIGDAVMRAGGVRSAGDDWVKTDATAFFSREPLDAP